MIAISQGTLQAARRFYSAANTPLYVFNRLKEESGIRFLATNSEPAQLYSELSKALTVQAATLDDTVRPYVLLTALALTGNLSLIIQAQKLPTPYHKWIADIARYVAEKSSPTELQRFDLTPKPVLVRPGAALQSNYSTQTKIIGHQ